MYSIVINGDVLDFSYKGRGEDVQAFYVGDTLIGQVFKMRRGWSCVGWDEHDKLKQLGLYPISGFKTRLDASEFMLRMVYGC